MEGRRTSSGGWHISSCEGGSRGIKSIGSSSKRAIEWLLTQDLQHTTFFEDVGSILVAHVRVLAFSQALVEKWKSVPHITRLTIHVGPPVSWWAIVDVVHVVLVLNDVVLHELTLHGTDIDPILDLMAARVVHLLGDITTCIYTLKYQIAVWAEVVYCTSLCG